MMHDGRILAVTVDEHARHFDGCCDAVAAGIPFDLSLERGRRLGPPPPAQDPFVLSDSLSSSPLFIRPCAPWVKGEGLYV
jgi:hypothetical protein